MNQTTALDCTKINGFYGPGTWAAWVITLITSWVPIVRNNDDKNFHMVIYTLYTNWASLDTIRYYIKARYDKVDIISWDDGLAKGIAVSESVVFVGLAHAFLQFFVCFAKEPKQGAKAEWKFGMRVFIIRFGFILPLLALCCAYSITDRGMPIGVPLAFLTLALAFTLPCVITICNLFRQFSPSLLFGLQAVLFVIIVLCFHIGTLLRLRSRRSFVDFLRVAIDRYTYVPCAPQSLVEGDQAFALFGALFIFFCEFPGDISRLLLKTWDIGCKLSSIVALPLHLISAKIRQIIFLIGRILRRIRYIPGKFLYVVVRVFLEGSVIFRKLYVSIVRVLGKVWDVLRKLSSSILSFTKTAGMVPYRLYSGIFGPLYGDPAQPTQGTPPDA